MDTGTEKRCKA